MAEGDTIHRAARRIGAVLAGRVLDRVEAPSPRSPLRSRAPELGGRTLERAEARGKHLLLHLSGERVIDSHLGIEGRWLVGDGEPPGRRAWLLLVSESRWAAQIGGRSLRLLGARRARSDPTLLRLGPDPLAPGFDERSAAARLAGSEPADPVGSALLDQALIAGFGNVIRIEALFAAGVSPWRRVGDLTGAEALQLVAAGRAVMKETLRSGRRPKRIYGRRRCPRCGERLVRDRQGDASRLTVWCAACQR